MILLSICIHYVFTGTTFFFFFFFSVYYIAASHYYRGSPADEKTPPRTCDSSVQIRLNLFFFFIFPPKYTKLLANVYQVRCCCITHSLTIVKKKKRKSFSTHRYRGGHYRHVDIIDLFYFFNAFHSPELCKNKSSPYYYPPSLFLCVPPLRINPPGWRDGLPMFLLFSIFKQQKNDCDWFEMGLVQTETRWPIPRRFIPDRSTSLEAGYNHLVARSLASVHQTHVLYTPIPLYIGPLMAR